MEWILLAFARQCCAFGGTGFVDIADVGDLDISRVLKALYVGGTSLQAHYADPQFARQGVLAVDIRKNRERGDANGTSGFHEVSSRKGRLVHEYLVKGTGGVYGDFFTPLNW